MSIEYNTGANQLEVRNVSDTVSVDNVDQIRVTDGSLTDLGSNDVLITTGGSNWTLNAGNVYRLTGFVGVGKIPTEIFEVLVGTTGDLKVYQDATYNANFLTGEDDRLTQVSVLDGNASPKNMSLGVRGTNDGTGSTERGALGDSYLYANSNSNGLNIISQLGAGAEDDYIRFYAGDDCDGAAAMFITGRTGGGLTKGFTGIGTETQTELLQVAGNIRVDGQSNSPIFTLADAATITPDFDDGSIQTVTLAGNRIIGAPSNLKDGATYILKIVQDGVGSRTLTWNAVFKWEGGTAPTLSTAAAAIDIITFVTDGTDLYGVSALNFS